NNDLGYGAGNELLLHIARCLRNILKKDEAFARVGTDHFLFLIFTGDSVDGALQTIEKLRSQIALWEQPSGGYYSVQ
ncbi:MAG: diguanylate cyclase, partial [Oscillospiraceae bacterium]